MERNYEYEYENGNINENELDWLDESVYPKATLEEFLEFARRPENETNFCEMINGHIYMMAGGASFNHGRISGYIFSEAHHYLRGKKCEAATDTNVYLFNDDIGKCNNMYQPDIMIGCDKEKMTSRGYEGTPEFVAEVVSKSSARNDYLIKLNYYMKYGVKEYWIVDMYKNQVLVYINGDGDYPYYVVQSYTFNDTIESKVFEGLRVDFKEISKILGGSE